MATKTKSHLKLTVSPGQTPIPPALQWKEAFADHLHQSGCARRTILAYLQDVSSFAAFYEQENDQAFTPDQVTSIDLRNYRAWAVQGKHLKPSSWNRRMIGLQRFCAWLQENEIVAYNPFQGIERYPEEEMPPRWLDRSEFSRFLRQVELAVNGSRTEQWRLQALRDRAIIALMGFAGMREGEVVALNIGDLQLGQRSGKAIIWLGKGEKKREVPLGREARQALHDYLENISPQEALFTGKGGTRISERLIQRRVEEYGRLAGVPVTPHMLRHTFAKRLVDAGVALTMISKLLGHARLDTTARYVRPGWDDLERAVEDI